MADAAAAEMEQMKVEEEKKEVVTALAGAFGVAPPVDTGCVARARTLFRDRAARLLAPPSDDRSAGLEARGSRAARAARARPTFAPHDPPLAPHAARAARRPPTHVGVRLTPLSCAHRVPQTG
jgi:hypothetical protein